MKTQKVAVYSSHGEPFSEMKDTLKSLGVKYETKRSYLVIVEEQKQER